MRRILVVALGLTGVIGALSACGDESATGVGSELIGPGATTFEVVLGAGDFLEADTTFDNLGNFRDAGFRLIANQFAGELDAHTLFQISRPFTVTYQREGSTVTDSIRSIRGGRVTLVIDTIATSPQPITVEVRPVTESWDQQSVSWQLRYDTAGVSEPWTQPGGTTAASVGSAEWTAGDTLVVEIDSASAAVWQDTAAARRGALVRPTTAGKRMRISSVRFEFDVVPDAEIDTVVTAGSATRSMHIANPPPADPPPTELRVGGLPVWRTLLRFKPLEDLVVDLCAPQGLPPGDAACQLPLRQASISLASLLLDPSPIAGHRLERPIRIEARALLPAENVPLSRTPLDVPRGFAMQDSVPPSLFTASPPEGERVAVPVTQYVRGLVDPDEEDGPLLWVALVQSVEGGTYGYTAFSSMESAQPPRLRLVLTVPNEEIFR